MGERLFILRVEHSQTDHEFIGVWAESYHLAEGVVKARYPQAYYYSCAARVDKIL